MGPLLCCSVFISYAHSDQSRGLPRWFRGKESTHQCRRHGFNPWVGKIPWRGEWLPTPVFLPGEFHEQRSPVGYSPWGQKELDTNEQLTLSLAWSHVSCIPLGWVVMSHHEPVRFAGAVCP